jgi:DNA-binding SARP family transcriptional activator
MAEAGALGLQLLDRFRLTVAGDEVVVPPHSATVVAYLAVSNRPLYRSVVAGTLWPKLPERRALASLRSAMYRIGAPVVASTNDLLQIRPDVRVDFRDAVGLARTLITSTMLPTRAETVLDTLGRELLPNGDGIWLEPERERYRHLRLRALDALASRLTDTGRHAEAVEVAQGAIAIEPMSETAEAALVRALVAEGNEALAVRQYKVFKRRLWAELHVHPARSFAELSEPVHAFPRDGVAADAPSRRG